MANIHEYNPQIDFKKHIFWQYNDAPAINSLADQKQAWYKLNFSQFWTSWVQNVLNIHTANDYGLTIWGILLGIPRMYNVSGNNINLSREQYRTVILARLKLLHMRGTVPEINELLKFIYGKYGKAYVIDNYDMTMTYRFNFDLSPLQIEILKTITLLPRPAGVDITIVAIDGNVFGFNSVFDTVATYTDLQNYDTSGLAENTIILVFSDSNNDDKAKYYMWSSGAWVGVTDYTQLGQPFDQAPFAAYLKNM